MSSVLSFIVGLSCGACLGVMILSVFVSNKKDVDNNNDEDDNWKEYKK